MIHTTDLHFRALRQYKKALARGDYDAATKWLDLVNAQRVMLNTQVVLRKLHHARKSLRNNRTATLAPVTKPYNRAAHTQARGLKAGTLKWAKPSPRPTPAPHTQTPKTPNHGKFP